MRNKKSLSTYFRYIRTNKEKKLHKNIKYYAVLYRKAVSINKLCVILAANAVKTKRLRISEPSFYHFIFLKNLYNKSILFEQRIGIASKRVSSSHSHHLISCNFWMSSSLNLFFINLAGFPPTIE